MKTWHLHQDTHQQKKKQGHVDVSPGNSPVDCRIEDLKRLNIALLKDLEKSNDRETELTHNMEDVEAKLRKDMMMIESESNRKAQETQKAHQEEILNLRSEVDSLHNLRAREKKAQQELSVLRDELDLMEHTKEKLADTEEKLRKCRERMEHLGDVRECLKREEDAHHASVEQCLRFDNELKALQPLRRQLEEYKTRAVDAEFELAACQDDLKRMDKLKENLDRAQHELIKGALSYQEEAESLRNKLSEDSNKDCEGPPVGEGLSEMNPKVKKELLELRNENARLKQFAAKREDDEVQRLEERLEDIQLLSDRFKEQYLTTKKELEATCADLHATNCREEKLKEEVANWSSKCSDLENGNDELNKKLFTTKKRVKNYCR
mmetsp:Transcript_35030/g.39945  ORF Transcript_35030/g.39945 Transcript_35030/m.39945 type:complete len:379 (-) Transcript_35030:349-1485(-)